MEYLNFPNLFETKFTIFSQTCKCILQKYQGFACFTFTYFLSCKNIRQKVFSNNFKILSVIVKAKRLKYIPHLCYFSVIFDRFMNQ